MRDGSPATRARAARAVLEVGIRGRDIDMDERLDALEEEVRQWAAMKVGGTVWTG